jgi:hypothetical protein
MPAVVGTQPVANRWLCPRDDQHIPKHSRLSNAFVVAFSRAHARARLLAPRRGALSGVSCQQTR